MKTDTLKIAGRMPMFKPELRQAIREGIKTETRRVMKKQPPGGYEFCQQDAAMRFRWAGYDEAMEMQGAWTTKCPYGKVGDMRVMREPLYRYTIDNSLAGYVGYAGYQDGNDMGREGWGANPVMIDGQVLPWRWKRETLSSMFMPTACGRTLVRYLELGAERLHDITDAGAMAEGIRVYIAGYIPRQAFIRLWDRINARRGYPWKDNPWVWVVKWQLL